MKSIMKSSSLSAPLAGTRVSAFPKTSKVARNNISLASATDEVTYQGVYGPWKIDELDRKEVFLYRLGINVAAAAAVSSVAISVIPESVGVHDLLLPALDPICLLGAAGLGLSLTQIHIYVDFLKKTLQVFWLLGLTGGLYLMTSQDTPAALYAVEHREAIWLIGPLFAALTGVAFKEGLCYGKAEAAGLFFTVPLLLLGHLTGLMSSDAEHAANGPRRSRTTTNNHQQQQLNCSGRTWTQAVKDDHQQPPPTTKLFKSNVDPGGRKWTQAVKDDLGDKSVFIFCIKDGTIEAEEGRPHGGEIFSLKTTKACRGCLWLGRVKYSLAHQNLLFKFKKQQQQQPSSLQ
eukprot:gene13727-19625_t